MKYKGSDKMKSANISIRTEPKLKEQTEDVLNQLGLSVTTVVNMLFHQIVREQAVPLSLSLKSKNSALDDLLHAKAERQAGYNGRPATRVIQDMKQSIAQIEV